MTYYLLHSGQSSAERLARRVPRLVAVRDARFISVGDIVIRYGNLKADETGYWTVNRRESLRLAESPKSIYRALRRSGVHCPSPSEHGNREPRTQLVRHYRIPVFNLKALACFRTEGKTVWLSQRVNQIQDTFSEVNVDLDEQARKVCLLAVRSVHALGLEFGLVSIGINPYGRLVVLDVAPTPVCKGRLLDIYAGAMADFIDVQEKIRLGHDGALLLGTDLEFMLKGQQGQIMMASRYFPTQGAVGCDARTFGGDRAKRPLAELRPEPARTPEELIRNIEHSLAGAAHMAKKPYPQWLAGSAPFDRFPIGGHIHFSGLPFTGRIVNLLDIYVGLPLMLIEDPTTAKRRRPRYGFLGDIRHKSYGGFEYRTPGSFLVDPGIAMGALALAYIVALHHTSLPYLPLHLPDNIRAFYKNDRDHLLPLVEEVREHIAKTPTYIRYKEVIDPIFSMIRNDEVWDESVDIRTAWAVPVSNRQARKKTARKKSQAS